MASTGLRQCIRDVTPYLLFLILVSTLGTLLFGFHLGELNAPQDVLTCKTRNDGKAPAFRSLDLPQCIPMDEAEFAFLSSAYVIGGFIGAIFAGPVSTSYGRLLSMRLTSFLFVPGALLETLAGTVAVMSIGRLLAGIAAGASTVIVPLYISEIAPPKERGLFGSMTQVTINIGLLFTQSLGYYLSYGSRWRFILGVGTAIGLLQAVGLCFVPESPSWLAANKSPQRAMKVLQRIRGKDISVIDEIQDWPDYVPNSEEEDGLLSNPGLSRSASRSSKASQTAHVGFVGVLRDPFYRPAIVAVIGIMFAQQFCGINAIMMYSVSLLKGLLPVASSLITVVISVVNLFTTIACAPLADKIGRKACLLLSIAGMGSMSLCLALSLRFEIKILSAISVIAFVAFFATGLGPVPFIMASEFVGQEAVGATQSWCLAANYLATFIVAQFLPIVNTKLNTELGGTGWIFFIFSALALLSFLFVSWAVPETRGKTPDEAWGRTRRID